MRLLGGWRATFDTSIASEFCAEVCDMPLFFICGRLMRGFFFAVGGFYCGEPWRGGYMGRIVVFQSQGGIIQGIVVSIHFKENLQLILTIYSRHNFKDQSRHLLQYNKCKYCQVKLNAHQSNYSYHSNRSRSDSFMFIFCLDICQDYGS